LSIAAPPPGIGSTGFVQNDVDLDQAEPGGLDVELQVDQRLHLR
jgi:hypothetical protein